MTAAPVHAGPEPGAWQSHDATIAAARPRRAAIDVLRGFALLGMVLYHGAWDLHAFRVVATDPTVDRGWRALGTAVAVTFLALSGLGLGLAIRQGASLRRMLLRLARIAAAAGLVSVATWVAVPAAPVWFGILHCIVLTNAVALVLRRAPTAVLLAASFLAGVAPHAWQGLPGPVWAWTGLASTEPATLDFRPLFPWLAPVLLGLAVGRHPRMNRPVPPNPVPAPWRWLAWAGCHSLTIYLVHQPVMVATLAVLLAVAPARDPAAGLREPNQAAAFLQQCERSCRTNGGEAQLCVATCHCVLTGAVARPRSVSRVLRGSMSSTLDAAVAACRPETEDPR